MSDTDVALESVTIGADSTVVFDTLGALESYPEWLKEFKSAEVLTRRDDGWPERARFGIGAAGISLGFTLDYTYADDRMAWKLVEGDMLHKLDGAYVLADEGDGTTTLTYELEVDSTVPLPGMVRRRIALKIVRDSLKAIKARAEAQA